MSELSISYSALYGDMSISEDTDDPPLISLKIQVWTVVLLQWQSIKCSTQLGPCKAAHSYEQGLLSSCPFTSSPGNLEGGFFLEVERWYYCLAGSPTSCQI